VPSYASSQLDREKTAIEADRAVLKQLDDQLDSLGRQIELERTYLDKTSQYAVDTFNAKVDRYNELSRQDKAATAAFNVRVDNYNAKLKTYSR
jgi:multidrug resistance efflux pump